MNNFIENIIYTLLKSNNFKVSKENLNDAFDNQPFAGTLLQIKQGFNSLGIPNLAIELNSNDKDKFLELPITFISHLKNTREFILIDKFENNKVKYIDESGKRILDNWADFESKWSGVALLTFPEFCQHKKNKLSIIHFKTIIWACLVLSVIIFYSFSLYIITTSWYISTIFITKIIGIAISFILLENEYNIKNSIIESLCSVEKNDCNKLLKSQDSKLFNLISWAELGLIYFSGSVLSLILSRDQNLNNTIAVLLMINIPTLLFSFYSVWYQYFKAKLWCRFCLITIGLFWVEAILFWNTPSVFLTNNLIQYILLIVIGFSIPIIGLLFIKPLVQKINELKKVKRELNEIKYNDNVINTLLKKDKTKSSLPNTVLTINGELESPNTLTIVTSPTCPPCAKAHRELEKYFNGCYDDLCVNLVFIIDSEREKDTEKYKIAERMIQIYNTKGAEVAQHAINTWYNEKDFEKWNETYPAENIDVTDVLKMQHEWCKTNSIHYTPTIIFNNRELPKEYKLEDVRYLMN